MEQKIENGVYYENGEPKHAGVVRVDGEIYYAGHKGNQIIYTDDFYIEMYKKATLEGKTYVTAYNELGFDTAVLGEPRANAVGMRVMNMADEHKLFKIDFSKVESGKTDFGIVPEQEVIYLLCERVEYMRRLLESLNGMKEAQTG